QASLVTPLSQPRRSTRGFRAFGTGTRVAVLAAYATDFLPPPSTLSLRAPPSLSVRVCVRTRRRARSAPTRPPPRRQACLDLQAAEERAHRAYRRNQRERDVERRPRPRRRGRLPARERQHADARRVRGGEDASRSGLRPPRRRQLDRLAR